MCINPCSRALPRVANLLVPGLLLAFLVNLLAFVQVAQAAPIEFKLTKPGQSVSQLISSSMLDTTSVASVRLCVPTCISGARETKPGGKLTLDDGAIWKIEQSGTRSCDYEESYEEENYEYLASETFDSLSDYYEGVYGTCTEEWKVTLTSPPDLPRVTVEEDYPGVVEITFYDEGSVPAQKTDLRGLYTFTPPTPAAISFETLNASGKEGELLEIALVRKGNATQVAEPVVVEIGDFSLYESSVSAMPGLDYTLSNNTVAWAAGERGRKKITVKLLSDDISELTEKFALLITDVQGSDTTNQEESVSVSIEDVPPLPVGTVQFALGNTEVLETAGRINLTVTRTGGSRGEIIASVLTTDGTATEGADYIGHTSALKLRWAAGDISSKTVPIDILRDELMEDTEDFKVILTTQDDSVLFARAEGVSVAETSTVTVNILNVDPPKPVGVIEFTQATIDVRETDNEVKVSVARTGGSRGRMTALVSSESGTAIEGEDFTGLAPPIELVWEDGNFDSKTVTVAITDDRISEPTESFTLRLAAPEEDIFLSSPGQTVGRAVGPQDSIQVNIINVDPPPRGTIQFTQAAYSVAENAGDAVLMVSRIGGSAGSITAFVTNQDGTATADDDYTGFGRPVELNWEDGDTDAKMIKIPVKTDSLTEPDETFTVSIDLDSASNDDILGATNVATVTISDVPPPPRGTLQFTASAINTSETAGSISLQISRLDGKAGSLSVQVTTENGSAESGKDYAGLENPLTLTWKNDEVTSKSATIEILPDSLREEDETFTVMLSELTGSDNSVVRDPSTVKVTIKNVDPALPGRIAFAANQVSVEETDGKVSLSVLRTGGSDGRVRARVVTNDGSATDEKDYTGIPDGQILVWDDGDAKSQSIMLPITDDRITEPLENFTATLSIVSEGEQEGGATLGELRTTRIDIINVDPPPPGIIEFAAAAVSVLETDGKARLLVNRTGGSAGVLRAVISTEDGSAEDGLDYTALAPPVVLEWADKEDAQKFVDIVLLKDELLENTETFDAVISSPDEGDSVPPGKTRRSRVSITDVPVDKPGSVSFALAKQNVSEATGEVTAVLQRSGGDDGAISVLVTTEDGTATSNQDYTAINPPVTITWADGDSADKIATVKVAADNIPENPETFSLGISSVGETLLGNIATQTVTIEDTTEAGVLVFANANVMTEEDAGPVKLVVNRLGGSDGAVSVNYSTLAGTAESTADFTEGGGTLTWADGDATPKTLSININNDKLSEAAEKFSVVLSGAKPFDDATLIGTPATAVVTINAHTEEPVDAGVVSLAATEITVAEDAGTMQVSVNRENTSTGAISVDYTLVADTATAGEDFVAGKGTLKWADGDSSSKQLDVELLTDVIEEADERFSVVLSNAQAAANQSLTIGNGSILVNITDTTERGTLQLLTSTLIVTEAEAVAVVQVERVNGTDGEIIAGFNIIAQTAEAGTDFNAPPAPLRWENGESGIKEIRIAITADNIFEPNETFMLQLLVEGEPEIVNNNARDLVVTIRDSAIVTRAAANLVIISGDNQVGNKGDLLEPLVLEAQNEAGLAVNQPTTILWSIEPAGSAELLAGPESLTNNEGRSSNQARILSNGFIRIIATVVKPDEPPTTESSRINPAPLPLTQGQIAFIIRAGLQARPGLSSNQSATGAALDDACEAVAVDAINEGGRTPAQDDLLATCQQLQISSSLASDLDRLGHEEYFAIADSVTDTAEVQLTNIYSRINALRSGRSEKLDLSSLQLNIFDQAIPGSVINAAQNALSKANDLENDASASSLFSKLGFFASGSISRGEVDGDGIEQDTDVNTRGITIGTDYRISNSLVVGAGLGLVQNETDFAQEAGGIEVSGLNLTLFGTWYESDKGYVDLVLDIGQNSYDLERQLNIGGADRAIAQSDTDASVLAINLGAGKNFRHGSWEFGPYVRFSAINASVDAFSESVNSPASFGSALDIQSHDVKSVSLSIGGQLAKTVSTGFGIAVPQLRFEFESENETRKDGLTASFSADPESTPFTLEGRERDTSFANIGLGTSLLLRNGKRGFIFYETRAAHDYVTQHWLKLGFRAEF